MMPKSSQRWVMRCEVAMVCQGGVKAPFQCTAGGDCPEAAFDWNGP